MEDKQFWFSVHVNPLKKDGTPVVVTPSEVREMDFDHIEEPNERSRTETWAERMATGRPFLDAENRDLASYSACNVSISRCFNCDEICIWFMISSCGLDAPKGLSLTLTSRTTLDATTRKPAPYWMPRHEVPLLFFVWPSKSYAKCSERKATTSTVILPH